MLHLESPGTLVQKFDVVNSWKDASDPIHLMKHLQNLQMSKLSVASFI